MPIYEYRCLACGKQFEAIQKVSDRPLRKCPTCAGKLEKLISRSSFQLKGGGWYASGYAKSSTSSKGDGDASDSSSAPAKETSESSSKAGGKKDKKDEGAAKDNKDKKKSERATA